MTERPKTLSELLEDWHQAKQQAEYFASLELKLRKQIFGDNFDPSLRGTQKKRIEHEMALIGVQKFNYNIDRPGLEAALQGAGDNERAVIDSVISYSPKVKEAAFENLSDEDKLIVGPFITVKPGTPTLEIKPQSKVRW